MLTLKQLLLFPKKTRLSMTQATQKMQIYKVTFSITVLDKILGYIVIIKIFFVIFF